METPQSIEITSRDEHRPAAPDGAGVGLVRLSPNGSRLAFHADDGTDTGVYVCDADGRNARRLVSLGDATIDSLAWSPSGEHLAYVGGGELTPGVDRWVGWTRSDRDGELGRVTGIAFDWGPKKPALMVADLQQSSIVRVDIASGDTMVLGPILDDGALHHRPDVASSGDGQHVAYSCRSAYRDLTEVHLIKRGADGAESSLVTQIPGADVDVRLFWSPKSRSLAMCVFHHAIDQSGIIVLKGLEGDGEVMHHHDRVDLPTTPAWSPDGRWVALFCRAGSHGNQLMLLDVQNRKLLPLNTRVPPGSPHFLDDTTLAVDSYGLAVKLGLQLEP
jgi:Tol biopolymer transport system component